MWGGSLRIPIRSKFSTRIRTCSFDAFVEGEVTKDIGASAIGIVFPKACYKMPESTKKDEQSKKDKESARGDWNPMFVAISEREGLLSQPLIQ